MKKKWKNMTALQVVDGDTKKNSINVTNDTYNKLIFNYKNCKDNQIPQICFPSLLKIWSVSSAVPFKCSAPTYSKFNN